MGCALSMSDNDEPFFGGSVAVSCLNSSFTGSRVDEDIGANKTPTVHTGTWAPGTLLWVSINLEGCNCLTSQGAGKRILQRFVTGGGTALSSYSCRAPKFSGREAFKLGQLQQGQVVCSNPIQHSPTQQQSLLASVNF